MRGSGVVAGVRVGYDELLWVFMGYYDGKVGAVVALSLTLNSLNSLNSLQNLTKKEPIITSLSNLI